MSCNADGLTGVQRHISHSFMASEDKDYNDVPHMQSNYCTFTLYDRYHFVKCVWYENQQISYSNLTFPADNTVHTLLRIAKEHATLIGWQERHLSITHSLYVITLITLHPDKKAI